MSKLNNWFIGLGVLSTNGLVWGDISGIHGYSSGELVDYSAGKKCDGDRHLCLGYFGCTIKHFSDYGALNGCNSADNNSTSIYEIGGGISVDAFST